MGTRLIIGVVASIVAVALAVAPMAAQATPG